MSDKHRIAEAIDRLALQFEGMVEASKILKEIGSAEDALAELHQQTEAARVECTRERERLLITKQAIQDAENAAATIRTEALQAATVAEAKAQDAATKIKDDAKRAADALAVQITTETESRLRVTVEAIRDNQAKLLALNEEIRRVEEEARVAAARRDEVQATLDAVEEALERVSKAKTGG